MEPIQKKSWQPPDTKSGLYVQNKYLRWWIILRDFVLISIFRSNTKDIPNRTGTRFLICINGHLGDALNALYVVRAIKTKFPHSEINVIAPRWVSPILHLNTDLAEIFWFDHWAINRSKKSILSKIAITAFDTLQVALKTRRKKIEIAIDTYYYWPNYSVLLRLTGIKTRIGFISGGGGKLLTNPYKWTNKPVHYVQYIGELCAALDSKIRIDSSPMWKKSDFTKEYNLLKERHPCLVKSYIVLHPGSGAHWRKWAPVEWARLTDVLIKMGYNVIVTGSGVEEEKEADLYASHGAVSLVGKITFVEYLAVLANANFVFGVESLCGHLTAALGVNGLMLYTGTTRNAHWKPWGKSVTTLTYSVACAPCYLSRGCESMNCMKRIDLDEVLRIFFRSRPTFVENV